ncbi:MAG: ParB/RepB/Spo0J family partition protein [Bacilli bacterium]|nr:ParB/RepB/Spo0J family partition protein [Bacilli bacterium]
MYPEEKDEVVQLYLDDIIPNRFQPREVFDEKALKELAVSIKEHGVIQPIIVRSVNGKYEIIAGERRYKASALAGLTKIPAIIRDLDDKESSKVALLENLQRKNLNPIEEARTYQKILELDEMTQEELAKTMGKSQSAVANKIRLLSLSDAVQEALLKEEISERHARTLLNIPDAKKQKEMLKKVIDEKMNVRVLEEEIKKMYPKEEKDEVVETPKEEKEVIASSEAFVNTNPLTPTADLPDDASNYGKVTIAPPEGEDLPETNKYINYGEIGKETEEQEEIPRETTTLDVDTIKDNATDIAIKEGTTSLDNLLNIGDATSSQNKSQFITPAEKIVKTGVVDDDQEESSDYFSMPEEFTPLEISSTVGNQQNNDIFAANSSNEKITIDDAINRIKDLIDDLKEKGINMEINDMNFEKSYQMIIKINKEN